MAKPNKVKSYTPNLSENMTIRFSPDWKKRVVTMCQRHNMSEAEVMRVLLDVGLGVAETKGFHEAIRVRAEFLDGLKK